MRIDSGTIGMESARTYTTTSSRVRSYSVKVASKNAFNNDLFGSFEGLSVNPSRNVDSEMSLHDRIQKLREECIDLLIRLLFPDRNVELKDLGTESSPTSEPKNNLMNIGITTEYYYEESESTSFSAEGIVRCKDGSEISFNMNLSMSRSFSMYYSEEINHLEQALTDPLVINFDQNLTELSDQTFMFDIDSDGVEDEISKLVAGSGFLSLDLNDNGIIDDGSELFGTKSGNGFADLSVYDTDHDGFIDEDDEIFEKLKIMTIDESGQQHLYSLKEKNVGAIYLGYAPTEFSINSLEDNSNYGVVRNSGVFLAENGGGGSIQQIDLAVRKRELVKAAYA